MTFHEIRQSSPLRESFLQVMEKLHGNLFPFIKAVILSSSFKRVLLSMYLWITFYPLQSWISVTNGNIDPLT